MLLLLLLLAVLLLLILLLAGMVIKLDVTFTAACAGKASERYPQKAATCTRKTDVGESMSWRARGPRVVEEPSDRVRV